ncbi:lipopolysaccharide transport periplasmic protein LptA [Neisseria sp. ZJ106]|uniref:Lipopolysaccharide export system protein LptA n=1 Tax=Neisseria lisongii TaxID=2912188 RepID=A0ABY7RIJ8_9NEIS|nr:lipopolysaccharide transport periplasmic protein LptA [Neisseria lisongii]MCF7522168.1 lipopolysaccharide transport periplasmic protein LptA [Neisseria lisongii]WCL71013.1 lipopolysaccharide transport periplasmic protein LptA [Neisseria lisongii]
MMQKLCKAAATATVLLAAAPAFSLQSDSRQPIEIEADSGSLDQKNQTTTFSGNVIIKQGTLNIHAAAVTVSRNDKGEQQMKASGSPVRFSQTLDGDKGTVNGQGNTVEYASATGLVKLTGNAQVKRGGDIAQGSVITYNTRSEVYTIDGTAKSGVRSAAKSGRVSVVIQPSSKP